MCTCKLALSIFGSDDREASRAVVVVPMLEPRVRGYILKQRLEFKNYTGSPKKTPFKIF